MQIHSDEGKLRELVTRTALKEKPKAVPQTGGNHMKGRLKTSKERSNGNDKDLVNIINCYSFVISITYL